MKIILSLLLLTSCVHAPTTVQIQGPNGVGNLTSCKHMVDCYSEAYRICGGGGYNIDDSSSRSWQQSVPNGANPIILNHTTYSILYSCK